MDKLIRRQEAGDTVNFNDFGKVVFRQINGNEDYNRVDKINLNNPEIVHNPIHKKKFEYHDNQAKKLVGDIDQQHIVEQTRHISSTYVPKKG
jgi:hypothetical protein